MATIQWFPGHMAKARREVSEKLKLIDVVIELVDARIPESSRNPILQDLIQDKKRIIVLNKADLADPKLSQAWVKAYLEQGFKALSIDAQHNKGLKGLENAIKELMAPEFEKLAQKGLKPRPIRLMILGIPNVGKSTLINRFVGKNQAITGNKPGVTKAQRWLKIGKSFELLDTPGILWPKFEDEQVGINLAITGAIKDQLLHMDDLALTLLAILREHYLDSLCNYTKLSNDSLAKLTNVDLLLTLSQNWGFKDDYDAGSERLINDFRKGKVGRITLDRIPEQTFGDQAND